MGIEDLEVFLKRKIRQYFKVYFDSREQRSLSNKDFVIVSRNCWGGQIYQQLNMPYNTPFVGLFFYGPCYMKLLKDFDRYMGVDLNFIPVSKYKDAKNDYPIGVLDDIEIHFQHYSNEDEAHSKWNRRKKRMLLQQDKNHYFFMICDRRGVTPEDLTDFHGLPFKNKVSFSINPMLGEKTEEHIILRQQSNDKRTFAVNGKKLYKLTFLYFDVIQWLNTGKIQRTRFK